MIYMFKKCMIALLVSAITACVAPFYFCKKLTEQQYDESESTGSQSPLVHINIMHPYHEEFINKPDTSDTIRNSINSNEIEDARQTTQEVVSSEDTQIVPVETIPKRRRMSTKIWSSALKGQLDKIKSSSSDVSKSTRLVRAQVEAIPSSSSSSNESSSRNRSMHQPSSPLAPSRSHSSDKKGRKLSSASVKRWKNLKRTLICTSAEKSTTLKETDVEETGQRLTVPSSSHRSPLERSATLQKNRLVDVSTSTRLSANIVDGRSKHDEIVTMHGNSDKNIEGSWTSRESQNDRRSSSAEALQEILSLIKRQSENGRICNVKISGLTINQADLLNLLDTTRSVSQKSTIAEQGSIISIKYHRPRSSDEGFHTRDETSFYEYPLKKFYRRLPELFEDLSFSKLFSSSEVREKSHRAVPIIRVSDHSKTLNNSRDETSYINLPDFRDGYLANESMFRRESTLSKQFTNSHIYRRKLKK